MVVSHHRASLSSLFRPFRLSSSTPARLESSFHQVHTLIFTLSQYLKYLTLLLSQSGRPFASPKGHVPTWTTAVEWHAASAFKQETYRSLVGSATAVVHTLGTLLENSGYKRAMRQSDAAGLAGYFATLLKGDNPLAKGTEGSYERINKDSGVCVLLVPVRRPIDSEKHLAYRTSHLASRASHTTSRILPRVPALTVQQTYLEEASDWNPDRTFVYISAEDIFRPVIPARYITTKREAESEIAEIGRAHV